eukprot:Plantae.Rhodophyta-Rhodochaete_pulchella.ctg1105.p1 GENE.Plantae.Rhodophyta-Rhodochaete_pulchella.ctg1105~~Plantae.Rhodophyta-Rhodochaete_pulchella.ctg1105.p1  ORF type:complete len:358 (-),score=43.25 Plantae.Rhodophyta-Rhodochaete_pulchella.ctg1105:693-1658(-)
MKVWRQSQFVVLGASQFTKGGYERREKDFTPNALDVDLKDKEYMVTGANSGIGYFAALALASRGASVHMVCRNPDKGRTARDEIVKESGNSHVELHVCDMSSISQIKKLAVDYEASMRPLHGLVNNAGCMVQQFSKTSEGVETNFATNSLGPYVLTKMLLPVLLKHADGRVVFVSSGGMLSEPLKIRDVEMENEAFNGTDQYARNKRQLVVLAEELSRRHKENGIKFFSMHPGWCDTASLAEAMPSFHERFKDSMRTTEQGADTVVWLTIAEEASKFDGGEFFLDRKPAGKHLLWGGTRQSPAQASALVDLYESYCTRLNV